MPPDFRVFEALNRHGVPFVVIGGHAVNFHGHQRSTDDTDLIWIRNAESTAALLAALDELHAKYIGNDIDPATGIERAHPVSSMYVRTHHLMMLWTDFGWVDLFDYIPGEPLVNPAGVYESAIESKGLRFASLEWLRRMKRTADRTKDQLDLAELEKIHGPPPPPSGPTGGE